mmetsp:Transcript_32585/g.92380  ORF Transcript_32585/g.92380 Transcript_32585/m.92380 type:complete len:200 (-) Transcript_32585:950-1549(-)
MGSNRVYVGNLDPRVSEQEVEDEFMRYGTLRSVWVARKPPGFAFIDYNDPRDAEDAVRALNGHLGWRVEFSRAERGGGRGRGGGRFDDRGPPGGERRCYECNEVGHLARDCRLRQPGATGGRSDARARSPPRYRSRSPDRGRDRYDVRDRYDDRDRRARRSPSFDRRSRSPPPPPRVRDRSRDRSPPGRGRDRSRSLDR